MVVTAGTVPTHRVVEMRRALRHTALLLLVALVTSACATISPEERALLDDERVQAYEIRIEHQESLHPHNAVSSVVGSRP